MSCYLGARKRKLYLENFMCHERLSFDFGENMNFVIGNNGSQCLSVAYELASTEDLFS
jgi:hypothetical protein